MSKPLVVHIGRKLVLLKERTADEVRRLMQDNDDWKKSLLTVIEHGRLESRSGN